MNYEDITDFEINKAVIEIYNANELITFINNEKSTVYLCEKDGINSLNIVRDFDPCNNPSDAWPIIIDSKINLVKPNEAVCWRAFVQTKEMCLIDGYFYSRDKNPLRAAMIVYLKMNEDK